MERKGGPPGRLFPETADSSLVIASEPLQTGSAELVSPKSDPLELEEPAGGVLGGQEVGDGWPRSGGGPGLPGEPLKSGEMQKMRKEGLKPEDTECFQNRGSAAENFSLAAAAALAVETAARVLQEVEEGGPLLPSDGGAEGRPPGEEETWPVGLIASQEEGRFLQQQPALAVGAATWASVGMELLCKGPAPAVTDGCGGTPGVFRPGLDLGAVEGVRQQWRQQRQRRTEGTSPPGRREGLQKYFVCRDDFSEDGDDGEGDEERRRRDGRDRSPLKHVATRVPDGGAPGRRDGGGRGAGGKPSSAALGAEGGDEMEVSMSEGPVAVEVAGEMEGESEAGVCSDGDGGAEEDEATEEKEAEPGERLLGGRIDAVFLREHFLTDFGSAVEEDDGGAEAEPRRRGEETMMTVTTAAMTATSGATLVAAEGASSSEGGSGGGGSRERRILDRWAEVLATPLDRVQEIVMPADAAFDWKDLLK